MPVVCDVFDAEGVRAAVERRAARGRAARADRPAARARPAQDGGAGGRQRPHPHRGHAQPGRGGGRRGRATDGRAEHRVRVRADGRGPEAGGRPALGRRPVALVAQRRGAARAGGRGHADRGHRGPGAALRVVLRPRLGVRGRTATSTREVRRRRFPIVGHGSGVFSFIHVDDAADATVAAVERGAPGIYNVVDDEPAPMREWLPGLRRGDRCEAAAAGAALPGAAARRADTRRRWRPTCAVPRTSRRRPSSAGRHATRAGVRGSARRSGSRHGMKMPGRANGVFTPVPGSPSLPPSKTVI